MRRRIQLSLLLAVSVLATACVNVQADYLGPSPGYAAVPADRVRIYEDEADVEGGYEKIALVYADADVDGTRPRDLVAAARKKAGRLGANAIVIRELREPQWSTRVAGAVLDVPVERRARFLAIRVHDDGER